jgi:transcriptional regulator with XRE-family HTH domain
MQLKEWIEKNGKTIKEVADALGVSEMNVYRYISGSNIPRPENMQKITEYTGGEVQPNDFYKGE